jgi:hypothetical protein
LRRRHGGPRADSFQRELLQQAGREQRTVDRWTRQNRDLDADRLGAPHRLKERRETRNVGGLHVLEIQPQTRWRKGQARPNPLTEDREREARQPLVHDDFDVGCAWHSWSPGNELQAGHQTE